MINTQDDLVNPYSDLEIVVKDIDRDVSSIVWELKGLNEIMAEMLKEIKYLVKVISVKYGNVY